MKSFAKATRACLVAGVAVLGLSAMTVLPASGDAVTAPRAYCGADSIHGLAVSGSARVPCGTALQVANAYLARDTGGLPATVRVAGTTWRCRELQGDPNPFDRCVAITSPSRWVQITS
jgi:hypothetical protein